MSVALETIKVKDIHDYAVGMQKRPAAEDVVPLSVSRAKAWSENPHAVPDDVAMIVASEFGHCTGYLGLMPAQIRHQGDVDTVSWISTFYVPPSLRDSGLGGQLLMRAVGTRTTLAACGSSDLAIRAFRALRFVEPKPYVYYRLDTFHRNFLGLPFKAVRKVTRTVGFDPQPLNWAINRGNDLGKSMTYGKVLSSLKPNRNVEFNEVASVPTSIDTMLDERTPFRFYRDTNVVNWMVNSPWVSTNKSDYAENYYFDDYRPHFEYKILEVTEGGRTLGFVVMWLTQRDETRDVSVLDYCFDNVDDETVILPVAVQVAREFHADRLYVPDVCGTAIDKSPFASQLFKRVERPSFIRPRSAAETFTKNISDISSHYCDGDIPFA